MAGIRRVLPFTGKTLVKATGVTAGLAESNGSLLPGLWRGSLHVTCGLIACTPGSAPGPTLGNEYGKTLPFSLVPITVSNEQILPRDTMRLCCHLTSMLIRYRVAWWCNGQGIGLRAVSPSGNKLFSHICLCYQAV